MEGMEVETSLDVLSRAASLVETETDPEIIKARPVDSKCCCITVFRTLRMECSLDLYNL